MLISMFGSPVCNLSAIQDPPVVLTLCMILQPLPTICVDRLSAAAARADTVSEINTSKELRGSDITKHMQCVVRLGDGNAHSLILVIFWTGNAHY